MLVFGVKKRLSNCSTGDRPGLMFESCVLAAVAWVLGLTLVLVLSYW